MKHWTQKARYKLPEGKSWCLGLESRLKDDIEAGRFGCLRSTVAFSTVTPNSHDGVQASRSQSRRAIGGSRD